MILSTLTLTNRKKKFLKTKYQVISISLFSPHHVQTQRKNEYRRVLSFTDQVCYVISHSFCKPVSFQLRPRFKPNTLCIKYIEHIDSKVR